MSMLLEALKKAALDKKERDALLQSSGQGNTTDDSDQDNVAQGNVELSVVPNDETDSPQQCDDATGNPIVSDFESNAHSDIAPEDVSGESIEGSLFDPNELFEYDENEEQEAVAAESTKDEDTDSETVYDRPLQLHEISDLQAASKSADEKTLSENTKITPVKDTHHSDEPVEMNAEESLDLSDELDFSNLDTEIALEDSASEDGSKSAEAFADDILNGMAETSNDEELTLEVSKQEATPEEAPVVAAPALSADDLMAEIVADALAQTEEKAVEYTKAVSEDTEQAQQALSKLVETGNKRAAKIKARQRYAIMAMALLVIGLSGGYYYFLNSDDSSFVNLSSAEIANSRIANPVDDADDLSNAPPINSEEESMTAADAGDVTESNTASTDSNSAQVAIPVAASPSVSDATNSEAKVATSQTPPKSAPVTEKPSVAENAKVTSSSNDTNLRVIKTAEANSAQYAIQQAYQAYKNGQFDIAKTNYQEALLLSPNNRDVLLGLAAVEVKANRPENAIVYYRNILKHSPKDSYALSGLLSLSNFKNNYPEIESQVRTLLRDKPDDPHLHFLLGNLYSQQQNWSGARSSYQAATKLDAFNPDYVYNLAISFDRQGQAIDALHHYKQAEALAQVVQPSFSLSALKNRLRVLSETPIEP